MIGFFLPMIPPTVTHQEKKIRVLNGKPVVYEPSDLKAARAKLTGLVAKYAPEHPLAGPLQLVTKWIWPARHPLLVYEWKTSKPDTDNLIKLLKDCMTAAHYWNDDAQVASEITEKFYGQQPGIYVMIEELTEEEPDG